MNSADSVAPGAIDRQATAGVATPVSAEGPRCFECGADLMRDERYREVGVCGSCGTRMAIPASQWIELLFDRDSFDEEFAGLTTPDPLHFSDSRPYPERIEEAREKSGGDEAVVIGTARVGGIEVVVAVSDFRFIGGSMGYVYGERVATAMDLARRAQRPFVALTCSGGARMQEGMIALIQMSKTAAAAERLHEAGVPMITILGDPTTGGVYASYGSQGDVIIAEDEALIGFAGPRVRAVKEADEKRDTLHSEDLLELGLVDLVLPRAAIRDDLVRILTLLRKPVAPDTELLAPAVEVRNLERGWTVVERARHTDRPRAMYYIERLAGDFIPLRGDRAGFDDPAVIGGLARIGDTNCVVIAQARGDRELDGDRHDGRMTPDGYRKARRLMQLAERWQLPLVTFIDTPGAHDAIADEAAGLAGSISDCLATMSSLTTPSVSVVIGEGGSGGALALTMTDRILMQQNAMYAITSPEGAAAILFRDRERAPEVAEALSVSAADLLELDVIHEVVPEPVGGAHVDREGAARMLEPALRRALAEVMRGRGSSRREQRDDRLRDLGRNQRPGHKLLRNIGDVLGDAIGGAAGVLGSRLRRGRGHGNDATEAPESDAAAAIEGESAG